MEQKDKLKTVATAAGSELKATANKKITNQETATNADMDVVKRIIEQWGKMPRKAADQTIEKYGPPQEAIPSQLIWYNNGP